VMSMMRQLCQVVRLGSWMTEKRGGLLGKSIIKLMLS
jgi:hypothetical protein